MSEDSEVEEGGPKKKEKKMNLKDRIKEEQSIRDKEQQIRSNDTQP